jgi:hypothetical protein
MWMILRIGRSSIGRMLLDLKRVRLRTAVLIFDGRVKDAVVKT